MNNFNFSKMRCKKLAWMLEDWPNWLFLVDAYSHLIPRVAVSSPEFAFMQTNFGNNQNQQCQQGPPN